ncbi:MAG: hypothetical protein H6Q77_642 [Gemmatimonadetes bacterium]|nr:hypothetical protein [Gemmatimonadota bacterium]
MTAPSVLPVRVMVEDVWSEVRIELPSSTPLGDLKAIALRQAGVPGDAADYHMKYLGAELQDEDRSLADAGVVPNAALVVLPRRRRPLR